MPAITVDNPLELPKVAAPRDGARARRVKSITTAPRGLEGEGFPVRRAFAGIDLADLDPFVHMDQMGEIDYGPGEPKGTPWHPHRGFETVTYMMEGTFLHQDSIGGGGVIENGATQWMTAGAGILHIERPPDALIDSGGLFHGIQLWVNLPAKLKMTTPRYQDIGAQAVALLTNDHGDAVVRIIAGALGEFAGPGSTHTPITLVHATIMPGANLVLPWNPAYNALTYVLQGGGSVGLDRVALNEGQMAVNVDGDYVVLAANDTQDSRTSAYEVLILGGEPIREPVAAYGPFVMNTKDELQKAFEDYQAGRLGQIPANHI
ncbi:MAG: pirin family protein [Acidobacteriota bacterium]|nr:pirin family protein [Acidobacteriota bacterium]MDE3043602.1 pirin family protein [Acidobacteriota bacterium]MDE3106968.1 pirin family protein [Acidobacteriota bacterium]MDE3223658.1 pirin family protein [Acidobacteriota bacterium]